MTCGCDQRGDRKFLCSYHSGYEDGRAAGRLEGAAEEKRLIMALGNTWHETNSVKRLVRAIERGDYKPTPGTADIPSIPLTAGKERWRGICALCGRDVAVRLNGQAWSHNGSGGSLCASGAVALIGRRPATRIREPRK